MSILLFILGAIGVILELITLLQKKTDAFSAKESAKMAQLLRHCEALKALAKEKGVDPATEAEF